VTLSFDDAVEMMILEGQSRRLSSKTILFYRQRCAAMSKLLGAKAKNLNAISAHDLRAVIAGTSERSAPHAHRTLMVLFNFLEREELTGANPMTKVSAPRVEAKVTTPLTTEQMQHVLTVAKKGRGFAGVRDHAVVATLIGTGIRRSELSTLLEQDVDFANGSITVSRQCLSCTPAGELFAPRIVAAPAPTLSAVSR